MLCGCAGVTDDATSGEAARRWDAVGARAPASPPPLPNSLNTTEANFTCRVPTVGALEAVRIKADRPPWEPPLSGARLGWAGALAAHCVRLHSSGWCGTDPDAHCRC